MWNYGGENRSPVKEFGGEKWQKEITWKKILNCIIRENVGAWIELIWLRIVTSGGLLWHCNEHLGAIKGGEFLDCGPSGFKKALSSMELYLPDDT
jgi:hypothetical protein